VRTVPLLIALTLVAGVALAADAPTPKESSATLKVGDLTRRYDLLDPGKEKHPALVIVLHGGGGNAANAANMTGFSALADKEGFVVAYPDGTGRLAPRLLTWNARHCCAYAMQQKVDDVGFISALIDELVKTRGVDPRRVYVTGMSNGGMMAHRLGIELSDKIAAIAPVVGALFGDEAQPKAPVSALIFNGAEDKTVPPQGGPLNVAALTPGQPRAGPAEDKPVLPAKAAGEFWARADGCGPGVVSKDAETETTTYPNCKAGTEVQFVSVARQGHAWPGGRKGREEAAPPNPNVHASEMIWAFFKRHHR
jgi:polyhydroxybutyrate depolymerase